jgi:phosphoglycolate phosphatase
MTLLAPPKAILFDWDNTLVDTWPCIHKAMELTFTEMGHTPWTLEQTRQRVGKSLRDSFPELFGDAWTHARDVFYAAFHQHHIEMLATLPNAEEILHTLRQQGIPMGVVSNKTGNFLRDEIAHLGWNKYFSGIAGATDAARDKPDLAPVHMVLAAMGVAYAPEHPIGADVWFVGDSPVDMACAYNGGMTGIFIGTWPNAAPTNHTPIREISGIADFMALFS